MTISNNKLIIRSDFFFFVELFFFFPPESLVHFPVMNLIMIGILVVIIGIESLNFIKKKQKIPMYVFLIGIWIMWLFCSSVINNGQLFLIIGMGIKYIGITFCLCNKLSDCHRDVIRYINNYFYCLVLLNSLSLIIFPNAMYNNIAGRNVCWFLGEDNVGFLYYIVGNTFSLINDKMDDKQLGMKTIFIFILTVFFAFKNDIGAGKICVIALLFIFILLEMGIKIVNIRNTVIFHILFFILFIALKGYKYLEKIYISMGRTTNISGRTLIWDRLIRVVQNNMLIGNGYLDDETMRTIINMGVLRSAHNIFLQILFWGGIIGLSLFLLILIYFSQYDKYSYSKIYLCLVGGIFVFLLNLQQGGSELDLLFIMMASIPLLVNYIEKDNSCIKAEHY